MAHVNNSRSLSKSKYESLNQPTGPIGFFSFSSDTDEVYYSDSEGSKLFIVPKQKKCVRSMPSALHQLSDSVYHKMMNKKVFATSSPLSQHKNNFYLIKTTGKLSNKHKMSNNDIESKSSKIRKLYDNSNTSISSYTTSTTNKSNSLKKNASSNYNNLSKAENQEKTFRHTKHDTTYNSIKQVSRKTLNDTTNKTLNKKNKNNNSFQLNLPPATTVNSNPDESISIDMVHSLENGKNASSNYNNLSIAENQEKTFRHTKHDTTYNSIKQVSRKTLNDITNKTLNKKNKNNNSFQLNWPPATTVNSNPDESISIDMVHSLENGKNVSSNYNNLSIAENQEKTFRLTKHDTTYNSIKQVSRKTLNDITNKTLNKKNKNNNSSQLNLPPATTVNSNPDESIKIEMVHSLENGKSSTKNKIEENLTLHKNTTTNSNKSQTTCNINKHTIFDENHLNNIDLSNIFQMELNLKMFSKNIGPYLNSMKHDILQIMNKCMYKPDKQTDKESKCVNNIIKNINNIINANTYNRIDPLSNKKDYSTTQFVSVDLNTLNVLNDELEYLNKKMEQTKFPSCDNIILNEQENKSTNQLNSQSIFLEVDKSRDDLKSFKSANDNTNDEISSNKAVALDSFNSIREVNKSLDSFNSIKEENKSLDSFNSIREVNKSISLLLPNSDCINTIESSKKQFLSNLSLISVNELPTNDISKTTEEDLNYISYNKPFVDKLAPINNNLSSNFEGVNYDNNLEEKNQNRYWLRNNPKPTKHYTSPLFKNPFKTPKKSSIKSKNNNIFVYKGTGKKRVVYQYQLKTVLNTNSDECMKLICPESKNKKLNNGNLSTSVFDISKLKPKKIEKTCPCGIFPSQVPSSWNDSLHTSLHTNLHKLQFKSQINVDVASAINFNGFLFNIIKVTENCDDLNLRLTLKNINDFIRLELDFSKKSISNLNHSTYLAIDPKLKIIGYLEVEPLTYACIYEKGQLSKNLVAVKFGISKLWVMVKYRNNGVATKMLKQFCDEENLITNDIAFAFHGNHGIPFIKKYFANNSVLLY